MSLSSMLNAESAGDLPDLVANSISPITSPSRSERQDGFDFNTFLPDAGRNDNTALQFDYTAYEDVEDGITHWGNAQGGVVPLQDADSDGSGETDVEMTNGTDRQVTRNGEEADAEMVDDSDMICYGMLYHKDAVLKNQNMMAVRNALMELAAKAPDHLQKDHIQKFTLQPKTVPHIQLSLPEGDQFGILRHDMTDALTPLLKQSPPFQLEAVASTTRLLEQIGLATKPNEAIVQVNINIYGPRDRAAAVGDDLSNRKQWLQKPDFFKPQYPYDNPQALHFPELENQLVQEEIRQDVSTTAKPRAEEERVQKLVAQVHQALSRASELESITMAGDQRLKTNLLDHQQQALSYMWQRETGGIPEKFRLWQKEMYCGQEMYIHKVTRTRSIIRPDEMGGGVLADEMGMGKTLSTLALLIQTMDDGQKWAEMKQNDEHISGKVMGHTHATLVIVPSALLINNWMNEISIHTGDSLRVTKYHGQTRQRELDVLKDSDLVITTYNTLATEVAAKKSLLHKLYWYRVVLDEAHIIRRPATTFYRTCSDLEARSRWCLTGTPIQNRLEDIGALFAFLRADPFHSLAQFRRFICIPFEQGETVARDRLILLYDSLCLRRTKDILKLPGHVERTRELTLTPEEKKQYDRTTNILQRYMRTQVGQFAGTSGYSYRGPQFDSWKSTKFGLFQAHLQLRILCNHGTFQKPFSWKKRDAREERTAEREALISEVGLRSELMCDGCKQPRPILGSTRAAQNNFVENCHHSLCNECLEDCADMQHCPLCQRFGNMDVDMQDGENAEMAEEHTEGNTHHKDYFNRSGFSTKMNQLMEDVKEDLMDTKSIIFSCWTRTLDLIEKQLRLAKIVPVRVDGEVPVSKRQGIINRFADDKDVRVLLMTTGTGAFGLNLTAANRIFIIEPQWNPSVENQAIARAIRLRQMETVKVTRYVIKDTVEQEMQSQQIKKRERAEFGFARKEGEGEGAAHDQTETEAEAEVVVVVSPHAEAAAVQTETASRTSTSPISVSMLVD